GTGGQAQYTGVNVGASTGTSKPTITGAALDSGHFRWKWIKGGTRGTSGATFKYSKDGGMTWSAELGIGTARTYAIPNTGITVNFSTGTWVAGDEYRWKTVEPQFSAADVAEAIDELGAQVQKFRLVHLVGDLSASDAVTIASSVEALQTSYRYVGL